MVMIGNLTMKQLENELSFEVSSQDREMLENMREERANNIPPSKFHIFHLPTEIVCGDEETAVKVHEILRKYSKKMNGILKIKWI